MKDIDDLCKKNNIDYFLLGGSCIGAIRHKGFIPWDDDLDIIMSRNNYEKFKRICENQLNKDKYILQRDGVDWPLSFSKVRLKGTFLHEPEDEYASKEMHGIYVDIFPMDNVPDNNLLARLHYVAAKYILCYQLAQRKYKKASLKKRIMMFASYPLKYKLIRKPIEKFVNKYNNKNTKRFGFYFGRTKFKTSITSKEIYGSPKYVDFEDTKFPVPEKYHEYLTQMFGDYMKLPPKEQQKGFHLISVDFGNY